jgi:L-ornithine Nalpha-acyltransferase
MGSEGALAFSSKTLQRAACSRLVLAARGPLRVVLSRDPRDIRAAQELRFRVFYEELRARPHAGNLANRCDSDEFDAACDHLLVIDDAGERSNIVSSGKAVGTYRLLRQQAASEKGGFYSEREFDVPSLLARHPALHFIELGRSCVLSTYRTKPVLELLWLGIWNFVRRNRVDVMFGCASLPGTDPDALKVQLSYLAQHYSAPPEWRVRAIAARAVAMNRLTDGSYNRRLASRSLPPLVRGYTKIGCFIGEGAVIDHQFNTTDVFVLMPVSRISSRYSARFGSPRQGRPQLLMS